jgi:hypothetical protein
MAPKNFFGSSPLWITSRVVRTIDPTVILSLPTFRRSEGSQPLPAQRVSQTVPPS